MLYKLIDNLTHKTVYFDSLGFDNGIKGYLVKNYDLNLWESNCLVDYNFNELKNICKGFCSLTKIKEN